jgi:hypothetical protein
MIFCGLGLVLAMMLAALIRPERHREQFETEG